MRIATADLETDPFEHGECVYPFCAGFYDGNRFISWWSDKCCCQFLDFLRSESEPLLIYFHNGGRFDFFFFLSELMGDIRIINNRIVEAKFGKHILRDSWALMPIALSDYQKDDIDYRKMKRDVRESNRDEILKYLRSDCIYLHQLSSTFGSTFNAGNTTKLPPLTIAGAAMRELKKFHKYSCGGKEYDERLRDRVYRGGRNQVFRAGEIHGDIRVYDVNSMYPAVMRDYLHPISVGFKEGKTITDNTTFLTVEGKNFGAFAVRSKTGLDFTVPEGIFHISIHEFRAAMDTGTFKLKRIIQTVNHLNVGSFDTFVDHFYAERMKAEKDGNKELKLLNKFVLNSAYGKFAQNPDNYFDWRIVEYGFRLPEPWTPAFTNQNFTMWKKPIEVKSYYNVAIGASITGAGRSVLLRGLHATPQPLYCDTDSIICNGASSIEISDTRLGAWKCEAIGTMVAIAGKKQYALFDEKGSPILDKNGKEKAAHKGSALTARDILRLVRGEEIESKLAAPCMKFDGRQEFVKRIIRRTATNENVIPFGFGSDWFRQSDIRAI